MNQRSSSILCVACGRDEFSDMFGNEAPMVFGAGTAAEWRFNLIRCLRCGLATIHPKPPAAVLAAAYEGDYGSYRLRSTGLRHLFKYRAARWQSSAGSGAGARLKRAAAAALEGLSGKLVSFGLSVPLSLPRTSRILEVGIGSGDWLLTMRAFQYDRLAALDIEANSANLEEMARHGIATFTGEAEAADLPADRYDCIRMEQVIEHLSDPARALGNCRRALRPGGLIAITCPSTESISLKIAGRECATLDLPRHIYHFTPGSLTAMLVAAGFEVEAIRTSGVPEIFMAAVRQALGRAGRFVPQVAWPVTAPLYGVLCRLTRSGDILTAVARKPAAPVGR